MSSCESDNSPVQIRMKKGSRRRIIHDDSTSDSETELAPCTPEECDQPRDRSGSQSHIEIIGDSSFNDDDEGILDSFSVPTGKTTRNEDHRSSGSTAESLDNEEYYDAPEIPITSTYQNALNLSNSAMKTPARAEKGMKTSTPTTMGAECRQLERLDMTAIPISGLKYDMNQLGCLCDDTPGNSDSVFKHRRPRTPASSSDETEDTVSNLKQIKHFEFKPKSSGTWNGEGAAALHSFNDVDEDDTDLTANFTLPTLSDSDDNQGPVVNYIAPSKPEVLSFEDLDDSLQNLQLDEIHLGNKRPISQPRKAIFLNEPHPVEKKTYAYDPTNAKHQDFYGDVQRTVTKLAEIIENMPSAGDSEKDEKIAPKGLVKLFDHQQYGLRWLTYREREFPYGGILADEMGLGKTIMMIGLIMNSKRRVEKDDGNWMDTDDVRNSIPSKTTLVVCPVGCIMQWKDEINSKGRGVSVYLYHGPQRTTSASELTKFDVVLSSYATIASEMPKETTEKRKARRSPLERIYWRRIVLDEAHTIRNPKTAASQAICKLKARHRWAVTGTPVHNRPEDFYSIVKFLHMNPFDDPKVWNFWIGLKNVNRATGAGERLNVIAKSLILRRTKQEVEDAGGDVKQIPPKSIETVEVELSDGERQVYDHLSLYAKSMFKQFLENKENSNARWDELNRAANAYTTKGHKEKKKVEKDTSDNELPQDIRFAHIFALLTRLRQCAVLPYLIHTMLEEEEIDEDVSFDELNEEHIISKLNPVFNRQYLSAKIARILEDLETLRLEAIEEKRSMDKVVIISSWTSTLDILYEHLRRSFSCVFITGRENTQDRADNMKKFNKYPDKYHICLLSLMAGGVGLNLVGGNHVFFVEPHWNPQLELQAQDRCHRFGQTKNVFVRRYISKDTVEQRVLALQDNKLILADSVISSAARKRGGGLSIPQLKALFT